MAKSSKTGVVPFSFGRLFSKSVPTSLHVELLLVQGISIVLALVAFVTFSLLMGLTVYLTSILSAATGFFPFSVFIILFGLAVWILGLMGINAFVNGVQYHLAMQAVTQRSLDLNLAWKLSSARWKDALVVQGSILGVLVGAFILSLVVSFIFAGNTFWFGFFSPFTLFQYNMVSFLVVGALLVILEPYIAMALPVTYFENVRPHEIVQRIRTYVRPHYWHILATLLLLVVINTLVGELADFVSRIPAGTAPIRETAITFVIFTAFTFLIQIFAVLFTFTLSVVTQTLVYLHIGKPVPNTHFVTTGHFSTFLSKMAHPVPRASPHLPVKWKQPGAKRKR